MPTPTVITDLSQTAASNYPAGTDSPSVLDDVQRAHAAFIALLRDGKGQTTIKTLAGGSTTDIGGENSLVVAVTGTPTITSLGTNYNGPRFVLFTGVAVVTHNATLINLPGAANITTAAGDSLIAVPNSTGNGWEVISFTRAATPPGSAINLIGSGTISDTSTVGSTGVKVGYRDVPQLNQAPATAITTADAGKHIYANASGTFTIPANASQAFPVGAALTFVNMNASACTIAITSDTLYLGGVGTTGSRTLAQYGIATALKISATAWIITGSGLT